MAYTLRNGWTKERMIQAILTRNNGKQCLDGDDDCLYFNAATGNHCAVGCFIPDDEHPAMYELLRVHNLVERYPSLELVFPLSLEGMNALQECHDHYDSSVDMHKLLTDWINKNVTE